MSKEITEKLPYKCPVCGGPIVKEFYGYYGAIHRINKDGSVSKRRKNVFYETYGEDESTVYCEKCGKVIKGGQQ